jgi:membrane fusion protein (multidrug efflux system)
MVTKVTIKVDAYPDYDFNGTVTSFSPAMVRVFNLPDNASNFVKNSSTFTVKITIDANNDIEKIKLLRPGMNVDIDVHIK